MTKGKETTAVTVWCEDHIAATPVLEALRAADDHDLRPVADLAALADAATSDADILVLYLSPVRAMEAAMRAGRTPGQALDDWAGTTRTILGLHRANRTRVRLVDSAAPATAPWRFLRHFGLPATPEAVAALRGPGGAGGAPGPRDEILRLIARRVLLGDLVARDLQGELTAASLVFDAGADPDQDDQGAASAVGDPAGDPVDDPEAAFRSYQDSHQSVLQVELLLAQKQLMMQELEALYQDKRQMARRLEQMDKGAERARAQVDALETRAADKERALHTVTGMLRDTEAQVAQLRGVRDRAQQVLQSRSYRMIAPVRRLRGWVSRRVRA